MIKLYVLYAGDIICRDISQLNGGDSGQGEIDLANPIFLIHHPKGWVMWDAGLPDDLVKEKNGIESWIFHLSMKKKVMAQFEEIGILVSDVDYFAFSHVHVDHTGNANYFKSAKLVMQEEEYKTAFNPNQRPYNYGDYKELENSEVILLNGDYDLFGDGAIRFISTPGHTPGHQSLLLKLEQTGSVLISGDIAYYEENYRKKRIPSFNTDKNESLVSIEKIEQLLKRENA